MTENAIHARFRVARSPQGEGLYGVFDTQQQDWAYRHKDGTVVGVGLDFETARDEAIRLEEEQNELGWNPILPTNDQELN